MTFAGRMRELLDLEVEILRLRFAGLELDLLALASPSGCKIATLTLPAGTFLISNSPFLSVIAT